MSRTIEVKISAELHGDKEPGSEIQRLQWEALDTAWDLLRETAVKVVLIALREQAAEQGATLRTDEEMFAEARAMVERGEQAATSYLELAPQAGDPNPLVNLAGQGLDGVFHMLVDAAAQMAQEGLEVAYGIQELEVHANGDD